MVVQLPLYNEPRVAERLIDAAVALQSGNLSIQVLDDRRTKHPASLQRASWKRSTRRGHHAF